MYAEADQVLKRLKVDVNSVFQRVESLSGGRQQSVAIARAISFEPRVVILGRALGARPENPGDGPTARSGSSGRAMRARG
jgi:ABC-type arginine transport system ATPase subunit